MNKVISFIVGRGMGHLGRCISIVNELESRGQKVEIKAFKETHAYLKENLQDDVKLKEYEIKKPKINMKSQLIIHDWRPEVTKLRKQKEIKASTKLVSLYHSEFSIDRNDSSKMKKFKRHIRQIANQTDVFLHMNLLPPKGKLQKMSCLYIPIPLITRECSLSRQEVYQKLGLKDNIPFILIHMGSGLGKNRYREIKIWYEKIEQLSEKYTFVIAGQLEEEDYKFSENVIKAPIFANGKDLVQAAELVVSKPGMGILGDCISTQTPLLLLPPDNPERKQKVQMLEQILGSKLGTIESPEKLADKIELALKKKKVFRKKFSAIPVNGAQVANRIVEKIQSIHRKHLKKYSSQLLRLSPFAKRK